MKTAALPIPGLVLGAYPERRAFERGALSHWAQCLRSRLPAPKQRYHHFALRVAAIESAHGELDGNTLQRRLYGVRAEMSRDGLTDALMAQALALASRACLLTLGLRPYATQLMAARIMLDGRLAEMPRAKARQSRRGCARR